MAAPNLALMCLAPNREAIGTIFYVFRMMRPGREPDTSSVKYGDAVSTPQPRVKLAHIIKLLRITYPVKLEKKL